MFTERLEALVPEHVSILSSWSAFDEGQLLRDLLRLDAIFNCVRNDRINACLANSREWIRWRLIKFNVGRVEDAIVVHVRGTRMCPVNGVNHRKVMESGSPIRDEFK